MKFEKIHNKGQAQIFKNQYLEYLTKTHPLVIWGIYLPIIIYLPYYGSTRFGFSVWLTLFVFGTGIFFWSFFEYVMHRFLFHYIGESERAQKITYVLHGNHHEFPRDRQRLFMPPVPSLIIASVIFLLMYGLMGKFVFIFFPGFMLGYLLYGSVHYAIHAWRPPFKWMKPIWRNHHLHHYKSDSQGFGVSSHFWDRIFKTDFDFEIEKEDKEEVEKLIF
ncbi:MAG: sterol desaturase family protein [Ginsengibacter sp.]